MILIVSLCSSLGVLYVVQRARLRAQRGACFEACLGTFEAPTLRQDAISFPMLRGRYRGRDVSIEPIVDDLSVRKLPQLWAIATLRTPVPCRATVDAIARRQNTEFYSSWDRLAHDVERASDWPADVSMRTNNPRALPPPAVLARLVRAFDDLRTKELLVSPRGVQLVYQLAQADRARYLVLRQARFDDVRIEDKVVRHMLDTLIGTYETLAGAD